MSSIQFHPDDSSLQLFATGELDPSTSILLSAHLEFCSQCRQRMAQLEMQHAQQLEDSVTSAEDHLMLDGMLAQILEQNKNPTETASQSRPTARYIRLNNQQFMLPRALQAHAEQIGPWSKLPGKLQRARVNTHGSAKMNFIYMDEGSALPEHSHQGREITLVLTGSFSDENGEYHPGDYVVQDQQHQHSPRTQNGEDCLCLTLLDAPLHFSSGFASLLNPFSQLFFR